MEILKDLDHILVTQEAIRQRIAELGRQIATDYQARGTNELVAICITNGSVLFAADLLRQMDLYVKLDCVRVSSYKDETHPVTEPEIIDRIRLDISGQDVLLIDDVLDTGQTLRKIATMLQKEQPRSLKTCVMLSKQTCPDPDQAAYVGFQIPKEFVVGYGLDFAERYRNLPCIGVLKPELQNPPVWQTHK